MKKMAAVLAVLIAAVMVMGMTASAEAGTFRPDNRYQKATAGITVTGEVDTGTWIASAPVAVTIPSSAAIIDGLFVKNQVSYGFIGCSDFSVDNNQADMLGLPVKLGSTIKGW